MVDLVSRASTCERCIIKYFSHQSYYLGKKKRAGWRIYRKFRFTFWRSPWDRSWPSKNSKAREFKKRSKIENPKPTQQNHTLKQKHFLLSTQQTHSRKTVIPGMAVASSTSEQNNVSSKNGKAKRNKCPGIRVVGNRIYDSQNGKTCHQVISFFPFSVWFTRKCLESNRNKITFAEFFVRDFKFSFLPSLVDKEMWESCRKWTSLASCCFCFVFHLCLLKDVIERNRKISHALDIYMGLVWMGFCSMCH